LHFAEPVECTDTESWRTKVCVALPGAGRKPRELHMPKSSWRDVLPIHPAAELFSCALMSSDEKRALGEDIVKNGLTSPIVLWKPDRKSPECLLDGITRLDAIEIATGCPAIVGAPSVTAGKDFLACNKVIVLDKSVDPYSYVISANIRRRHLTAEQKRDLIAKLLKADPSKSDRQIGEMIKADNKTVASVRAEKEAREEIPHVETRIDSRGRTQHARKPRNPERAKINREMKLGTEIMEKIAGTSLATAREHDALIFLNRGAPEGGHTDDVKRLVADAVAGRCVSAVEWKNNGGPLRGDIGPDSNGECERLRDRIEELENEKYRLERSYIALRDEIGGGKPGLAEKLEPPLETLYEQGARNMVTMSPPTVATSVTKLELLLVDYGIMPPSRRTEDPQGYIRLLKQRAARHRNKEHRDKEHAPKIDSQAAETQPIDETPQPKSGDWPDIPDFLRRVRADG
jgi:hypothetical protein